MHAVVTGPITGIVVLPDGRKVDVSPAVVMAADAAEALAIADAIGARHQQEGHPLFLADPEVDDLGFTYSPSSPEEG